MQMKVLIMLLKVCTLVKLVPVSLVLTSLQVKAMKQQTMEEQH